MKIKAYIVVDKESQEPLKIGYRMPIFSETYRYQAEMEAKTYKGELKEVEISWEGSNNQNRIIGTKAQKDALRQIARAYRGLIKELYEYYQSKNQVNVPSEDQIEEIKNKPEYHLLTEKVKRDAEQKAIAKFLWSDTNLIP